MPGTAIADSEPGKLTILQYDSPDGSPQETGSFTVDFNPSSFNITNNITYEAPKTHGHSGGDPVFKEIPPINFNITFTIDGTGATKGDMSVSDQKEYVRNKIVDLRKIAVIKGDIHCPKFLAVLWGKIYIECVLTSLNITFTLFDADGTPLRAKITCNFLQRIPHGQGARQARFESPDLTKLKLVIEGDTLPLIARKNYESSSYYLQLAKANKLKNFRKLKPGTELVLPPMKNK